MLKLYIYQPVILSPHRLKFSITFGLLFLLNLLLCQPLSAQTPPPSFIEVTGTNNPLDGVDLGSRSNLSFVDIDGDGDHDVFIGAASGIIGHYENTGTNNVPVFQNRTGADNPFDGNDVGDRSYPVLVDIDDDNDFDAFIGEKGGAILYFENTGSSSNPTFTQQNAANNPFNGFDVGADSAPSFVDVDNDGDLDAFVGSAGGVIDYFENTGTVSASVFVHRTGSDNPFDGMDVGSNSTPAFVDIDLDGDMDAFSGEISGDINYFKNQGTLSNPTFVLQLDADNPLDENVGSRSTPTFVDIDGDGDLEAFSGEVNGTIKYYQNLTFILPVELVDFRAILQQNEVLLKWATATEIANYGFNIEHSLDGKIWQTIGFVNGNGSTTKTHNYQFLHESAPKGINYYRLKQIDFDEAFDYSAIVSVAIQSDQTAVQIFPNPATAGVVLLKNNHYDTQNPIVNLYNLSGSLLLSQSLNDETTELNVSQLITGIYIVEIQNNQQISRQKLMIE